jgi:chromosome segregation ATPase
MPDSAHDQWIKATLNVDPARYTAAPLPPLPPAPPDKQSQEFRAQFEAALAPIDTAVAYLSGHADDAKKAPVAQKREVLVTVYSTALTKVDPADEAKGKPALDQALNGVKGVAATAVATQQAAEKVFAEWTAREPKLEEAAGKIEEMEEWGYEKVAPLRTQLDAVEAPAEARSFDLAITAADTLVAAMKPVVDDYEKQKAAKEKYDPAYEALKPRLEKVGACTHVKLAAERDAIGSARHDMEANAQAKQYVDALKQLEDLTTQVGTFETALEDLERRKKEFEDAWKALQEKLGQIEQSTYKKLAPDQQAITAAKPLIESAAQAEDFDQAMSLLKDLEAKVDAFLAARAKLDEEKKAYDAAWAEVQPRLDQMAKSEFKKVEPLREGINQKKGEIDTAVQNEDYAGALPLVQGLSTQIDEYQKAVEQAEQEKKAYEEAWGTLQPKLTQTEQSTYQKLAGQKQGLTDGRAAIDAAVQEEDFVKAKMAVDDLSMKADEYLAAIAKIDEQKKVYEEAWNALQPKLAQTDGPPYKKLDVQRQDLAAAKSSIEGAVQQEDFEQAKTLVDDLSNKCDAFLAAAAKLDEQKQAFDKAWGELQPKLGQVQTATFKKLQPMLDDINKTKGEVDAAAQGEDYENALPMVGDLSNKVDAYLKKAEDTAKQKEDFEQADMELGTLLMDGIDKVSAPSLAAPANELRTTLAGIKPAMEGEDYEKALQLANDAKGKASALRAEAEKLRQSIKDKVDTIETDVAQLDVGKHPIKERIDQLIAAIRSEAQSNEQLDKAEKDLAELPKLVQQLKDDPAAKLRNNPDYQAKLRAEQEAFDAREIARADYERAKAAYDGTKVPTTGVNVGLSGAGPSGGISASGDPANPGVKLKEVDLAKAKLDSAEKKLDRSYQDRIKLMQKAGWKGKLPEKGQDYPRAELTDFLKR